MLIGITLIKIACAIYIVLGAVHALLTLFTKAMHPVDSEVMEMNQSTHAYITSQTSLWSGSIGFHLSHSLGLVIFGALYFILAIEIPAALKDSATLTGVMITSSLTYVFLSVKYWFYLPSIGLGLASALTILGFLSVS